MAKPEKSETEDIIREIKRGRDREGNFGLLFKRYYDQVYRFFQREGLGPEDCRDLTQEVFVSAYKGIERLRDETQFQSWLFQIAKNVLKNEVKRRRRQKRDVIEVPLEEDQEQFDEKHPAGWGADPDANPMAVLLNKEKQEKLDDALNKLPPQMQQCIQLRVAKGLSYAEISAVLGISINTVKVHIHQARKILKEKLGKHFMGMLI